MDEEKLEQRIKDVCDRYSDLISAASTDQEKEKLRKELDLARRRIYFGAEMKKRRKAAGKKQLQLSKAIKKSESYVKKVEAGVISLQNKPEIVDKVVENLSGWSRHQAYNMLGIDYDRLAETMTVDKAKKAFAAALVDSQNAIQFILQVLNIRTKFEMDFRQKMPGEFLPSQEIASVLFNIKDMNSVEIARAFVKIGIKANLTQKQWERIFRACKNDYGKSSLEPLEKALRTVIWDEETGQSKANEEQEAKDAKNFEKHFNELEMVNKELNTNGVKNLKRNAFFILNEFFADLLTDDERETFMKLMDSIEGRS